MTESELQKAVIDLAHIFGWKVAHFRPAMNTRGQWMTPVQADGAGFPDLIMAHDTNGMALYAIELKTDTGKLSAAQVGWLKSLNLAGCYTDVWRPKDWASGRIEKLLRLTDRTAVHTSDMNAADPFGEDAQATKGKAAS